MSDKDLDWILYEQFSFTKDTEFISTFWNNYLEDFWSTEGWLRQSQKYPITRELMDRNSKTDPSLNRLKLGVSVNL